MQIVTLTTDSGLDDHYTATLKGHLLSVRADLHLIDVSHNIKSFDIVQAAFVVKQAWHTFPEGTIHLILVHHRSEQTDFLLIRHKGHFFLMPDNGTVTLLFDEEAECRRVRSADKLTEKQRISRTVQTLVSEGIEAFGEPTDSFVRKIQLQPVVTSEYLRGAVIHIDHYDNVLFNITKDLFSSVSNGRAFELYYKRHDPITQIHNTYFDVPVGEPVCVFNDAGFLVLAINMGRAASLLGLKIDDTVQIHFIDEKT